MYCILISVFLNACNFHHNETKLVIYTRAPLKSVLYVTQVALNGEQVKLADSAIIKDNHDSLVFYIPNAEQHFYSINLRGNRLLTINFVNDSRLVRVRADYFADTCSIVGSPASISLKGIDDKQAAFSKQLDKYLTIVDSIKRKNARSGRIDSLIRVYNIKTAQYFNIYKLYADTVKNPVVFIKVFTSIQFGKDYKGLRKFITQNGARFRDNKVIQDLMKQTSALLRIYELELNVGEAIPSITLPDRDGFSHTTGELKGKYYLIDFWATWCQQCFAFKNAESALYKADPQIPVQLISVAIDNNEDAWQRVIKQFKYPAVELIDTKMYQGPAVNTLLFDSIPFNFLVNPQGKIIAKAIKPDSLRKVIMEFAIK
jgi:thiol-disulfide isomerase/thioredoxin